MAVRDHDRYHFLFVPITIGLSAVVAWMHTRWVRHHDPADKRLTKFFGKLFMINFALGLVTGIVQEFQFGMNWSDYSRFVGDIFGAPLAIEALLAFFLESTFLGPWLFGWGRIPEKLHAATMWIVHIGTVLSAYFILAANSFMQHPVGFAFNPTTGRAEMNDFVAVLTNKVQMVTFPHTMAAAYMTGGAFVVAAWVDVTAGLVAVATVVVLAIVAWLHARLEARSQRAIVTARAEVTTVAALVATNATPLAAIGGQAWVVARLATAQAKLRRAVAREAVARALGTGLVPTVVVAHTLAMAVVARDAVAAGLATPLAALVVLVPLALGETVGTDLADTAGWWARARAARTRLVTLLSRGPAIVDVDDPRPLPADPAARTLAGVTARWEPERDPVAVPDLVLHPGDHVGVVGPNGSGKSTAVAVLARHLDPSAGHHLVDDIDATACSLEEVRARLAMLDDQPHVFGSTLRENLRLARPAANDEDLLTALDQAGLAAWHSDLPDGLGTRLGAGGRGLSGGERTRLGVARTLLARRPVVVMDEPAAHLDHPTAVAVVDDVVHACADQTLVVVMHRPEGMDRMDHIVTAGRLGSAGRLDTAGRRDPRGRTTRPGAPLPS